MYEDVWDRQELLFKIKIFKDRVDAFESGEQYMRMKKLHQIARAGDFQTIKRLKRELAQERAEKIHVRELWYATCLDMQHEYEKRLAQKDNEALLERRFADTNGYSVGDEITAGGVSFKIVGLGSVPDYDAPLRNLSDTGVQSEVFGVIFVTADEYDSIIKNTDQKAQEYAYSYRLGKDFLNC